MADLLFHALELPYVGNLPHFRVDLVVRQTAKGFLVVRRLAQLPDDFELQRMAQDKPYLVHAHLPLLVPPLVAEPRAPDYLLTDSERELVAWLHLRLSRSHARGEFFTRVMIAMIDESLAAIEGNKSEEPRTGFYL
jgi:hypothetical protein